MRNIIYTTFFAIAVSAACKQASTVDHSNGNPAFAAFLNSYYEKYLKLNPLDATFNGDNRYNDQLPIDISDEEQKKQRLFYQSVSDSLKLFDYAVLSENDKLSYDVLKSDVTNALKGFSFTENLTPLNQFSSLTLTIAQLGSGVGQPFATVGDYDNWLKRIKAFANWADTSIVYMKKGIEKNYVLPKALVLKTIPQMNDMVVDTPEKSLFYSPIETMPTGFSKEDKERLTSAYKAAIMEYIVPAYKKIRDFLQQEYLPKSRTSAGISALANGKEYYEFLAKINTTTSKTPEEIYNIGLTEVSRIKREMEMVKNKVGFKGNMQEFFEYLKTDKQFTPYKKPEEVISAFWEIYYTMRPNLNSMFADTPKTRFEIKQTEAFRAASASAEYNQGTLDGSRPGIFYVPILDASKFNITSGMESLFLHEAIPGHHYQISMQMENTTLPQFRRFGGNNAYVEGWALYCESLGKELGLYTNPYQYFGALGDEMHRAIRLVVDVAIHTKNMSREDAIKYMMDNEAISEQGAIAEIERYMAIPGQALGYKIGALKIRELRTKYEKMLGNKFNLSNFHNELLKDGSLPLDVLEKKMDRWMSIISNG